MFEFTETELANDANEVMAAWILLFPTLATEHFADTQPYYIGDGIWATLNTRMKAHTSVDHLSRNRIPHN